MDAEGIGSSSPSSGHLVQAEVSLSERRLILPPPKIDKGQSSCSHVISASLISAKEDKERQGKCPWEDRGRDAAPAEGKATEEVSRGVISPKQ